MAYNEDGERAYPQPNFEFNMTGRQGGPVPSYDFDYESGHIEIRDDAWGKVEIGDWVGDEIFFEMFQTPGIRRLGAIEQLTLPSKYATMPNTAFFTRWQHAWGSLAFVRQIIEREEASGRQFEPREKTILQLRTFLSDVGHTAFSHLGDWLKQGFGGTEDSHDDELGRILKVSGITDVLTRHDITIDEVVFPSVGDWIECPSPDLCVDRVDYGVREIIKWVDPMSQFEGWLDAFTITPDNQLVMRDEAAAKRFALDYALLATEHWAQPVHSLQLQLFAYMIKGALVEGGSNATWSHGVHNPLDLLYSVDPDLMYSTASIGTLNYDVNALMLDIGRSQRRIFAHGRESEITSLLRDYRDGREVEYPDPLMPMSRSTEYTGVTPPNLEFLLVDSVEDLADFGQNPGAFDIFLPALKSRFVNPTYYDEGKLVSLIDTDENMRQMAADRAKMLSRNYVGRIHLAPWFADRIKAKTALIEEEWQRQVAGNERASDEALRDLFQTFGSFAAAHTPFVTVW